MNYRKLYMRIIFSAKQQERKKGQGIYYELHHILPKSLFPLWAKRKDNLVLLTAKEHFFCHQLLTKIYPTKQMFLALWKLCSDGQNNVCSPSEYEKIKLQCIKNKSFNTFKGKTHTEEVRNKIRASKIGSNNPSYGKHWYTNGEINILSKACPKGFYKGVTVDEETKKKCAHTKNIGKHWFNDGKNEVYTDICPEGYSFGRITKPNEGRTFGEEARLNMSKAHKGKKLSDDTKRKISEANKGKKHQPPKYKKTYNMTEDHKKKLSEIRKNKNLHWYTNGIESIQCSKCPDGFWPGRKIK